MFSFQEFEGKYADVVFVKIDVDQNDVSIILVITFYSFLPIPCDVCDCPELFSAISWPTSTPAVFIR